MIKISQATNKFFTLKPLNFKILLKLNRFYVLIYATHLNVLLFYENILQISLCMELYHKINFKT